MKRPWIREWLRRRRASEREAEYHLKWVEEQQPLVDRLARELTRRQRENHFAEWVREAMGGGGQR